MSENIPKLSRKFSFRKNPELDALRKECVYATGAHK